VNDWRILAINVEKARVPHSWQCCLRRRQNFLNNAGQDESFSDAAWDMELFSYVRISFGLQKHGGFLFLAEVPPTSSRPERVTGF
jgi:hypothetical protein